MLLFDITLDCLAQAKENDRDILIITASGGDGLGGVSKTEILRSDGVGAQNNPHTLKLWWAGSLSDNEILRPSVEGLRMTDGVKVG